MRVSITRDILESSLHCRYKAYLKILKTIGAKTEYELLQSELKEKYFSEYLQHLKTTAKTCFYPTEKLSVTDFQKGYDYIIDGEIESGNSSFRIDILEKVLLKNGRRKYAYIPIIFSANEKVSKIDKELIFCIAYLLEVTQGITVKFGRVIYGKNHQYSKINTTRYTDEVKKAIDGTYLNGEPQLFLNPHCQICEYNSFCKAKAKKDDNLSLLDRATPKIINKYHKKGIFTIQQLSYLFKPRRIRKRRDNQPVSHNLEIQALAIRTNKIYIHQLPDITRQNVEIFLDIEGIPDKQSYYLIGLLISEDTETTYLSFWADKDSDQAKIWQDFLKKLKTYPDVPVYHYGSYEPKALDILGKRFNTDVTGLHNRFVNIINPIYGKIYFPVYSNSLKDIGKYIGASWSSTNSTGIQSLVWRHRWEETQNEYYKQLLEKYNSEDCQALKLLTDKLSQIKESAEIMVEIDFINQIKKNSSKEAKQIHIEFDTILKFGHENYNRNKISFKNIRQESNSNNTSFGGVIGHKGFSRKIPKARKSLFVPIKRVCPVHKCKLIKSSKIAQRTVTDLVFTKNMIRKSVIKYIGNKSYCPECKKHFSPPQIKRINNNHFGHNFKAWVVYQRLFLRLPFQVIQLNLHEMFNEHVSKGALNNFFKSFANFYEFTQRQNFKRILKSPFIHVDETKINVKGMNQYVWIFTNGKDVVFKRSKSREVEIVKKLLKGFQGILISDFYPGFDSLECQHQKCWAHLIRDMNDDLWKYPFDSEYEKFILEFRNLILPIFESVERYGLKKRHFNKFRKSIDRFYTKKISEVDYKSEIVIKYQNRLKKYWENLFTFLKYDNIPWNNNMAERGLRHLAVQRKISTYFAKGIDNYLLFLGIMQTCKFQNKSFLKFLLSGKKGKYNI